MTTTSSLADVPIRELLARLDSRQTSPDERRAVALRLEERADCMCRIGLTPGAREQLRSIRLALRRHQAATQEVRR